MPGPPPKPTALKIMEGNPGKRKLNDREPKPADTMPKCPTHLSKEGKKQWRKIAGDLYTAGLLTAIDGGVLAAYCQAWGRWVEAETELRKHGPIVKSPSGYPIQNPYLAVANKAISQMHKAAAELGMTPASRSRITTDKPDQQDELESFLKLTA